MLLCCGVIWQVAWKVISKEAVFPETTIPVVDDDAIGGAFMFETEGAGIALACCSLLGNNELEAGKNFSQNLVWFSNFGFETDMFYFETEEMRASRNKRLPSNEAVSLY